MGNLLSLGKYWAIEPDTFNNLEALNTKEIPQLENTRTVKVQNGIAIIPVQGIITGRMDFMTYILGGTALDILAKDFRTALENPDIKGIVLDFDSPGGIAVGPAEMAEFIYKSRGTKPIVSYVGRNCCSAAYWLAAATDKIVVHSSAVLGSIGVVSAIPVQEQPDSEGYKRYEIVSSNAKAKRPDPRTEEGLSEIKRELDALETQFIDNIARFRNLPSSVVRSDFGNGGVMIGHDALARSMADELGSFESVLETLTNQNNLDKGVTMDKESTETTLHPEITADYVQKEHPEIAKMFTDDGYTKGMADGIKSERERIMAIEQIAMPGHEELVKKAKADGLMTAEKLAIQMVTVEKERGIHHLAALQLAETEMPKIPEAPTAITTERVDPEAPVEDRAKAEWNKSADLRREFANEFDDYLAFKQAEEKGSIKILTNKK